MNLTYRQLILLVAAITALQDTTSTNEMKQELMELSQMIQNEAEGMQNV